MQHSVLSSERLVRTGSRRTLSRVLMLRPDYFAVTEAKNPFSHDYSAVDPRLAMSQWEGLRDAFRQAGLEVLLLDPQPCLEDMCFVANQAFVGVDHDGCSFAIPSRMLHGSRRDEVEFFTCWYASRGYKIIDMGLEGEEFLEGAGDLLWNADWQSVWAGFGHRSTRAAVDQFAVVMQEMRFDVHKLEMTDPYFYHLNLCLTPLTPESLLIYPGAFSPETLAQVRRHANTIEVTREEALQFVCNGVSVNGYYILPWLNRRLHQALSREGLQPVVVNLSEFQKAGGSAAGLKMLLA